MKDSNFSVFIAGFLVGLVLLVVYVVLQPIETLQKQKYQLELKAKQRTIDSLENRIDKLNLIRLQPYRVKLDNLEIE